MGWGLGHATRSIPIINDLKKNNKVILASNGTSLSFLRKEYPELECITFPDYAIRYPKRKSFLLLSIILQIPLIIIKLIQEYNLTQKIIIDHEIDILISDCRYGVFSKKIPTYFITHQLRFKLTYFLKILEPVVQYFNIFMFQFYKAVIIPDTRSLENLTGELTHKGLISKHLKLNYLGVFCNVSNLYINEDIDIFISISGPEIQRTLFEEIILGQINDLPGRKVVVLGKPDSSKIYKNFNNTIIFNHVNREKQNELLNRAKFIICRSGYTTIMELVALKKSALMIPTPGQTEQEYLAKHLKQSGLFYIAEQKKLNLFNELKKIDNSDKIKKFNIATNDINKFRDIINV